MKFIFKDPKTNEISDIRFIMGNEIPYAPIDYNSI